MLLVSTLLLRYIPRLIFSSAEPAVNSQDKIHVIFMCSWICFASSLLRAFVLLLIEEMDIVFLLVCVTVFGSDVSIMLAM